MLKKISLRNSGNPLNILNGWNAGISDYFHCDTQDPQEFSCLFHQEKYWMDSETRTREFAYLIWFDCSDLFVTIIMVNAGFSRRVINEIHFCPPMFSYSVIDGLWS